jgi:hypothetical protein
MNPKHLYVGDRVEWANKWHGIEYTKEHDEILKQKNRDRVKAAYQDSPEYREHRKQYVKEYQTRNKIKAMLYLGGECQECGEKHPAALQFHHRDPSTKSFTISSKELSTPRKRPWDTVIIPELDKCDLLCSNCHFKHHHVLSVEKVNEIRAELEAEHG